MKKIILLLFITAAVSFAGTQGSNSGGPHDSLLFDGENSTSRISGNNSQCYWKVVKRKGFAYGTKRYLDIGTICGVPDTVEILKNDSLRDNDILADGSLIETGKDGQVAIAVFLKSHPNSLGRMFITTQPSTLIKIPQLGTICDALETEREIEDMSKVLIIKGKVTYDSPPSEKVKIRTEGKRSSVKHKKTKYSHEVSITGADTVDIIRVYEGSVEINHIRTDFSDLEQQAGEMERLTKEFQEGKITMEELSAKIAEYTNSSHNTVDNLKGFIVDEGSKCILDAKTYRVELLGPGDEDTN